MTDPLVSVVIPAYNQQELLRETLASALGQTFGDIEVVVVDDGSSDGTRDVCIEAKDPRVIYVRQDNDGTRGIGARNVGMSRARSQWIAPLDQDDVWLPQKLESQLALAGSHPEVGAVFCRAQFIDGAGVARGEQGGGPLPQGNVFHLLLEANRYYVSSGMFRRSLIGRMGLPHESVGLGDWALWLSVSRHAEVAAIDDVLLQYRFHPEGYQQSQLAGDTQAFWEDHWALARYAATRLHPGCRECIDALGRLRRLIAVNQARMAGRRLRRLRFDELTQRHLQLAWSAQPRRWTLAAAAAGKLLRP